MNLGRPRLQERRQFVVLVLAVAAVADDHRPQQRERPPPGVPPRRQPPHPPRNPARRDRFHRPPEPRTFLRLSIISTPPVRITRGRLARTPRPEKRHPMNTTTTHPPRWRRRGVATLATL